MTNEIDISRVLIEGDTATIMGVKYKRVEEPKTSAEEAYKRWWGDYPPTTPSVSNTEDERWSDFQKGYTSAKEDYKVGEYQPTSQEPETLLDVIRNLGYSYDCCYEIVDAVEKFEKSKEPTKPMNEVLDRLENKYENDDVVREIKNQQVKELVRESVKWCEEHQNENVEDYLTPQTPEQVADGLKEAFREAIKQNIVSSVDKPKTMTDILYRWWCDVFTSHSDWDMETSIEDLVDRIELFLPKEQSAAGSQNVDVVFLVDGFNDCLKKIKGKLR